MKTLKKYKAFTLVELLVVIAIIGILGAILLPAMGGVKMKARTVQCQNNVKQIASAILMYANDHNLQLPSDSHDNSYNNNNETFLPIPLSNYIKDTEVFECPSDKMGRFNDNNTSYYYALNDSASSGIDGCDTYKITSPDMAYSTKKITVYDACFDSGASNVPNSERWHDKSARAGVCGFLDGHAKKLKVKSPATVPTTDTGRQAADYY